LVRHRGGTLGDRRRLRPGLGRAVALSDVLVDERVVRIAGLCDRAVLYCRRIVALLRAACCVARAADLCDRATLLWSYNDHAAARTDADVRSAGCCDLQYTSRCRAVPPLTRTVRACVIP